MIAAAGPPGLPEEPEQTPDAVGSGGLVHLSPTQDNIVIRMALNPRNRWELSEDDRKAAIRTTRRNMKNKDGRVRNQAVANMIRMEGQNQSDEHHAAGDTIHHEHTLSIEQKLARLAELDEQFGTGNLLLAEVPGGSDGHPAANGHAQEPNGTSNGKPV